MIVKTDGSFVCSSSFYPILILKTFAGRRQQCGCAVGRMSGGMCPIWELEITFESEHKIMMNRAEEELPTAAAAAAP